MLAGNPLRTTLLRAGKQLPSMSQAGSTRAMSKTMPVVDAWAQPPEKSLLEGVPEVARVLPPAYVKQMSQIQLGPGDLIQAMDASSVSKVFLSAWSRPGKVVVTNEQVARYTTAYPDRFFGLGTVDMSNPVKAMKEIERFVKEYNFKGLRILPWLWNMPPTHNLFYPLFAKCVELDIPFCTQVGHTGPLCPSEPGRPIPYIDQIALDFPDLKIVGGHIGYPWTEEMIAVAWKHKNVYIDTSAHAPKHYPPQLIQFMNSYGSDKVMFGTNFPMLTWAQCVDQAWELPLKNENMEKFMWKNANRVFKLGMEDEPSSTKSKL